MQELAAGSTFAGYRIDAVAGRGGMGVVYRATQLALDRPVALKLIAPEFADDRAFRERFQRESQLAATIEHPNVIPIHEAGEVDGLLFIAMRFVPGTDLRELILERGHLEPDRAVAVVEQIAAALDAAHRRGLVHRDVKPANVLITAEDGEHAYLTDFGLTKYASASAGLTATGQWVGTVDYAAPEQIEGLRVDARTDVYALGCVLFQALTGRVPFAKDSDLAKLFAHASEPPPAPSSLVPELPAELDAIVGRALAKSPDERHPSAGDLGRAASAAVDGRPPTGREQSVAAGIAAPASAAASPLSAPAPPTTPSPSPAPPAVAAEAERGSAAGKGRSRRRLALLAAGLAALAAVAALALAAAGVFGGDAEAPEEVAGEQPDGVPEVVATVEVGDGPRGVAVDGNDVWVALRRDGAIARVDARTNELVGVAVAVGEGPDGVTADRGVAWVSNSEEGAVRRVESGGAEGPGVTGGSITVGSEPRGVSLGAQLAWVANGGDGTVSRIDRASATAVGGPIGVGTEPTGLFVGHNGVWVTNRDDGTVTRIDSTTSQVIGDPIPVGSEPEGIAQGLRAVWVVNRGDGTVIRLRPGSGRRLEDPIPVGSEPSQVAIGAGSAWVTVTGDNTVVRLDRDGRLVGTPIPVGTRPTGIAVGGGRVWVANSGDGTVSRIEP